MNITGWSPARLLAFLREHLTTLLSLVVEGRGRFNTADTSGDGIFIGTTPELKLVQQSNAFRFEVGGSGYTSRPMVIGRNNNNNDVYVPGRLGVGCGAGDSFDNGSQDYMLMVTSSAGENGYLMFLYNGGGSYAHKGIEISCGRSGDLSGTDNYYINFTKCQAAGSAGVGSITADGNTVAYNTFTGVHVGSIEDYSADDYLYGTKVRVAATSEPYEGSKQPSYEFERTTTAEDPAVMGVYFSYEHDEEGEPTPGKFSVAALGDGHIWVCDENGDIDPGDYIVSSTVVGHGRKQADNIMRNYTVAKVTEGVRWAEVSGSTKLLACTYHCG